MQHQVCEYQARPERQNAKAGMIKRPTLIRVSNIVPQFTKYTKWKLQEQSEEQTT